MITQDELDALPVDWEIGTSEEVIDGKLVRRPVIKTVGALFQRDDDALLIEDRQGRVWMTGWANGVRYKRERREYSR